MTIIVPGNRSSFALAVCRRLFSAVAATAILLSAGLAAAAEFEGFGPIKFGMTKEEAWEAIGAKGEWVEPDVLRYDIPYDDIVRVERFDVRQIFKDGRAADAMIEYAMASGGTIFCLPRGLHFAADVRDKYGVPPEVVYGRPRPQGAEEDDLYILEDFYGFDFGAHGSVQIVVRIVYSTPSECRISIHYRGPSARSVP